MPNMTDTNIMDSESAVVKDDGLYNKKIKPEPNPQALRDAKTDLSDSDDDRRTGLQRGGDGNR